MKIPKPLRGLAGSLALLTCALCATASATDILNTTTALTLTDPTQLGRLSRNGIPQDWAGTEAFPGVINTSTTYHYETFTLAASVVSRGPYIQISATDLGAVQGNLFVSAYSTSYLPNSAGSPNFGFDTHWLGDLGFSGNAFGVDPVFFQVIVPAGQSLVVVVNNTAANNGGVGERFNLLVESFTDTEYTDAPAASVPDAGASALLLGLGLAGLFVIGRVSGWRPGEALA